MSELAHRYSLLQARRELAKLLGIVSRIWRQREADINKHADNFLSDLSAGTEGFGLVGDRAAVTKKNVDAFKEMKQICDILSSCVDNKEDIKTFDIILRTVAGALVARSHSSKTIPLDLIRAVAEFGKEDEEEEEEEI